MSNMYSKMISTVGGQLSCHRSCEGRRVARVKSFVDSTAPTIGQHDLHNAQDIQRIIESIVMLTNEGQSQIFQHCFEERFSTLRQSKNWIDLWDEFIHCLVHCLVVHKSTVSSRVTWITECPWLVTRLHAHALEGILTAQWSNEDYWRRVKGWRRGGQW